VLHAISTIGAIALAFGMLVVAAYLLWALFFGERAPANPWGSRSYEWLTESPPPKHNFRKAPQFALDPYDYSEPMENARA
jgi:cytochrome c oxidase subunit 1